MQEDAVSNKFFNYNDKNINFATFLMLNCTVKQVYKKESI
jgi:hypothetical protein